PGTPAGRRGARSAQGDLAGDQAVAGPTLLRGELTTGERLLVARLQVGQRARVVAGLRADGHLDDRHDQAARAEGAERLGALAEGVLPPRREAGQRVDGGVLVLAQDPADVGPAAHVAPVRRRRTLD